MKGMGLVFSMQWSVCLQEVHIFNLIFIVCNCYRIYDLLNIPEMGPPGSGWIHGWIHLLSIIYVFIIYYSII